MVAPLNLEIWGYPCLFNVDEHIYNRYISIFGLDIKWRVTKNDIIQNISTILHRMHAPAMNDYIPFPHFRNCVAQSRIQGSFSPLFPFSGISLFKALNKHKTSCTYI